MKTDHRAAIAAGLIGIAALTGAATAQEAGPQARPAANVESVPLAADINETIVKVNVELKLPDGRPYTGEMIVTHFRPNGPGPFPAVVFSHGRSSVNRHEPARWRVLPVARFWTRRGFAVLVPTRIGYGEQGQAVDPESLGSCSNANYRPTVDAMASQVASAVQFAAAQPWIDPRKIVLAGVSYGGFATIGASARSIPGVIGAINFVGGLGGNPDVRPGAPCQGARITTLAWEAGSKTKTPMLWLYSKNDRYWGEDWPKRWHEAFVLAGGTAEFNQFPPVGEDGHKLMSGGFATWRPVVDAYLSQLGFKLPAAASQLPASGHARLDEADKIPFLKDKALTEGYAKFLATDIPRAFVIAPSGAWSWRSGLDAVEVAMSRCQERARTPCSLYAVDDRVVWKGGRR